MRYKRIVECLEKCGYNVVVNEHYQYVMISLKTKTNFLSYSTTIEKLECDNNILEHIVGQFNQTVKGM